MFRFLQPHWFLDDDPEEENRNTDEVDVYLDDDETEEEWRRKRHEREMFLKKVTADLVVYNLKMACLFLCAGNGKVATLFTRR